MPSALITGITGFVGPYLAKYLLEKGWEIYGIYRRRATDIKPKRLVEMRIYDEVHLLEGDVTDLTSLLNAIDISNPDIIFHLASQSHVQRSFKRPIETFKINCGGTQNILEAIRLKQINCKFIFAGSSEEYGLQIASEEHLKIMLRKYKVIHPFPAKIPELPITEQNPLRPMSPYAVSKTYGDFLARNYFYSFGIKSIISRAFNHEGAGRGHQFVTSRIVRQFVRVAQGATNKILIGNVNAFRDWSHILDIIEGYYLLSQKGREGEVYVMGSRRCNSVLTYILWTAEELGYSIKTLRTPNNRIVIKNPSEYDSSSVFGLKFEKTKVDKLLLTHQIEFKLEDRGIILETNKKKIKIEFDPKSFRPSDVPILISNPQKISKLGFNIKRSVRDIIRDQINYYLDPEKLEASKEFI